MPRLSRRPIDHNLCRSYYEKLLKCTNDSGFNSDEYVRLAREKKLTESQIDQNITNYNTEPSVKTAIIRKITCPKVCNFQHPDTPTEELTKEYRRKLRQCYCGSRVITLIKHQDDEVKYFTVCGATRKSIRNCL
jgi:hypothetical protein